MTIAEILENLFNTIEFNDEYDVLDHEQLKMFRKICEETATRVIEISPESADPSLGFTFEDGSSLILDNPRQECYCAAVRV